MVTADTAANSMKATADSEKTDVDKTNKKVDTKDSSSVENNENFQEHPIFKKYLPKELCAVLECWLSDGTLNEEQKETFRTSAEFLLHQAQTNNDAKQWINEQNELIGLTEKCLNKIASDGHRISTGDKEDPSLESFDWLIQAFENAQCKELVDGLVKSVTSSYYLKTLTSLKDPIATSLSKSQEFLLITCPKYISICDKAKSYSSKITNEILNSFVDVLNEFMANIAKWTTPIMSSLIYPIEFILPHIRSSSNERRKPLYDTILKIVLHIPTSDSTGEEARSKLIFRSLSVLVEIIRSDKIILNQLKNTSEEKTELVTKLSELANNENHQHIQLKAVELLSLLVPEEEFLKENSTEKVTALFAKNFTTAIKTGKASRADAALKGFKDLVQNDDVKQEVLKQNILPEIMKFAKEKTDDPIPLEVICAMSFNKEANKIISEDVEFVDHVKQLCNSEIADVSKLANGIMWKVEGEKKFEQKKQDKKKKKQENQNKSKEENKEKQKQDTGEVKEEQEKTETKKEEKTSDTANASEDPDEKEPEQYDMMISYCWAQQPICHKINDRLEKEGYKVWLDRDEMRGSIIESMAEAIENSKFVLICMSSNYKKSTNCKAEAEYAFNKKSKIIPLIVEPDYKADGWLGFLAGSKIYIDFADKEGEEFDKAYNLLIEELKRNGLGSSDEDGEKKDDKADGKTESKVEDSKKSDNSKNQEESKTQEDSKQTEKPKKKEGSEESPDSKLNESNESKESKTEEDLSKEPEKPIIETKEYLNMPDATTWNDQNVLEFLTDKKLDQLIPICGSMNGEAFLEFYNSCQTMPDIRQALLNGSESRNPITLATLFNFISNLKKYLPPKPERKVFFQYTYFPAPSISNESTTNTKEQK